MQVTCADQSVNAIMALLEIRLVAVQRVLVQRSTAEAPAPQVFSSCSCKPLRARCLHDHWPAPRPLAPSRKS